MTMIFEYKTQKCNHINIMIPISEKIILALSIICFQLIAFQYADSQIPSENKQTNGTKIVFVNSIPDSASVFINKKIFGRTPSTIKVQIGDTLLLGISKRYYKSWQSKILSTVSDTLVICPVLEQESSFISVYADSNDKIYLDDTLRGVRSVSSIEVNEGSHKLFIVNEFGNRSIEKSFLINNKEKHGFNVRLGYSSGERVAKALIIPGSAQLADGSYLKGGAFLLGTVASILFVSNSHEKYSTTLNNYNYSKSIYLSATTEADAIIFRNEMNRRHELLNSSYKGRTIAYTTLSIVYISSIIDGIINHLTTDEISLVMRNTTVNRDNSLSMSNISINAQVRFHL